MNETLNKFFSFFSLYIQIIFTSKERVQNKLNSVGKAEKKRKKNRENMMTKTHIHAYMSNRRHILLASRPFVRNELTGWFSPWH